MTIAWRTGTVPTPVISYLLSISLNGQHQLPAILGLFLSASLLAYAVSAVPHRASRIFLWLGCLGLLVMSLLACRIESLGNTHDLLSAATLASLLLGVFLGIRAVHRATPHLRFKLSLYGLTITMALLLCAYTLPNYFDNAHWWRNLAVAEWSLIALIQIGIASLI